jgi:tryptophanyl-tRNA synthetase
MRIVDMFGCQLVTNELLNRVQKVTGKPIHPFLRRGVFYAHRDLEIILKSAEEKKPFYLYTGRGPSSDAMHLGHLLPFIFNKYLQDAFKVPIVIQITDDEKYFYKGDHKLEEFTRMGIENIKDVIACGFDPERTFIFLDTEIMGGEFYRNVVRFQKNMTYNQLKGIFGLNESDNCGKVAYPAIQAVPALSSSFPEVFGPKANYPCLIPCVQLQFHFYKFFIMRRLRISH